MSVNRPFQLNYDNFELNLLIDSKYYQLFQTLNYQFNKSITLDSPQIENSIELFNFFIGFINQLIKDNHANNQFDHDELHDVLKICIDEFKLNFNNNDIHNFLIDYLQQDNTTLAKVKIMLKNYYNALEILNISSVSKSSLFSTSQSTASKASSVPSIYAIFGGQGNTDDYFEELRDLYNTYQPLIKTFLIEINKSLNNLLSSIDNDKIYTQGLDFINWLENVDKTPNQDYLLSVPVSCPLICILQLCHYQINCKILGFNPGEFQKFFKGATGHSQGLVTALAIASSNNWQQFLDNAIKSVNLLFFIGLNCLLTYPNTTLPPSMLQDSLENSEGRPSPMLSIRDLSREKVEFFINQTNNHLPSEKHISISLINGPNQFVLSGPPESLYGLNVSLRNEKAPSGLDQSRVPFSKRKLKFSNRFLPIFAPFHSHLLKNGFQSIVKLCNENNITFDATKINIPVYDTFDGSNFQDLKTDVVERLIKLIIELPVDWELATNFESTHILDFGPGGVSGVGILTHKNKDGTGSRIILAGSLDESLDDDYGFKQEIFSNDAIKYQINWLDFKPTLIKTKDNEIFINTKFSKILSRPPLMIPGMTPSTVNPKFVIDTLNEGYHIELAGGGYFSPTMFKNAIDKIVDNIKPGYGITVNLIYVSPRQMQWAIPLIKELREKGYPIQGLTIGAGVPSLEIANEYINDLKLTHLGLKPGSIDAINQVINIAKHNPNFPIIMQWTGGRGGGHHSFEDFHQPILQMYGKIRKYLNIVLVGGSGFGDDVDTYPYLNGSWSAKFKFPPMPFDGFLFGSRVMTAKECFTSLDAKKAIAACSGVDDENWESSFNKPTGGILTVVSEMGEPIHKIATRGVKLWKEFDDTLFNLPKAKLLEALKTKKDYIIERLNKDFQKVWFGKNANGVCDLEDMTYQEVSNRLIELMYVSKSERWIDVSLRNFFGDYLRRVEERFTVGHNDESLIQNFNQLSSNPQAFSDKFFKTYSSGSTQLINEEDCDYFLNLCTRPGQKPAPFVPVLNEQFSYYFKKDSLWQSEDLESVVDEDVGRTCILHGPVATKYANKVNEPIGEIMNGINQGLIKRLLHDEYNDDESLIETVEYLTTDPDTTISSSNDVKVEINGSTKKLTVLNNDIDSKHWFNLITGDKINWLYAFIQSTKIIQGVNHVENSIHSVLSPVKNLIVEINNYQSAQPVVRAFELFKNELKPVVQIQFVNKQIEYKLIEHRTADNLPVELTFLFNYTNDGFVPISEVMEGRNERIKQFYWKLWYGSSLPVDLDIDVTKPIIGETMKINAKDVGEFIHAIGNKQESFVARNKDDGETTGYAPMDFAIVIGWRAIINAIFPKTVDGDLLKLVHLSNGYRMVPGAKLLKHGDEVSTRAEIKSVLNQASGKMVEVIGTIIRDGEPVLEVTSQFLYRGDYKDFENTFSKTVETPYEVKISNMKDLAILKSKEWFEILEDIDLINKTLTFRCESVYKFKAVDIYSSIITTGKVFIELSTKEIIQIAEINYEAGKSFGNPVIDYLSRNGKPIEQAIIFENSIPLSSNEELTSKAPTTNEPYAKVSGDYNPIHVSRVFANYAKLPGTITHGMYSSGSIRSLVEEWAANSVPERVRAFKCNFVGMVLPNDILHTTLEHIGMINGRKIIKIETKNELDTVVLQGEAEIEQPITTYVFTGQGSQEQGMGMDLYNKSSVAKEVWDRADNHFINNYGFSILDIVKNNPNELVIHFNGKKGRKIRENYIGMMFETIGANGEIKSEKIFKDIDHTTTSYKFVSPTGLLSATQFTQPALTLMEKASYEDIKSKGLVPTDAMFAGHSLGEYSALSSLANVMPVESLVDVVFYRGMTMQVAVPRDELGRSNYGMCAVNPTRINPTFNDAALRFVVGEISSKTGWLLEIVNYNVENTQYVTAGDLRGLDTLTNVLNVLKINKIDIVKLQQQMSLDEVKVHLHEIITEVSAESIKKPQPIDLQRGFAVIPLKGISVPFHSSYLMSGVKPFQRFLNKKINKSSVNPNDLIGKYIPNLTAKPFEITKEYFEEVYALTKSDKLKNIIENWDKYELA